MNELQPDKHPDESVVAKHTVGVLTGTALTDLELVSSEAVRSGVVRHFSRPPRHPVDRIKSAL